MNRSIRLKNPALRRELTLTRLASGIYEANIYAIDSWRLGIDVAFAWITASRARIQRNAKDTPVLWLDDGPGAAGAIPLAPEEVVQVEHFLALSETDA